MMGEVVLSLVVQVHEHIVEHGIVRARRTHKVLGFFELEVGTRHNNLPLQLLQQRVQADARA
jgi:hypothetical protein